MIVATLHKSKAPNAAWLVEVKDLAVIYASSFLDTDRKRLPWVEDTVQAAEGIGYFRAEVDA